MHELGLARNIVSIASEQAAGRPVKRITLQVGQLAGVMSEAILFCFDVAAAGTLCEGATLEIGFVEGRARCHACGAEFALPSFASPCACGARNNTVTAGEELMIGEMELGGF